MFSIVFKNIYNVYIILPNISFYVPCEKERQTDLEQRE